MKIGFFSSSELSSTKSISTIPRCGQCGLYKTCLSPKMKWTGKGQKKILIIAEAPGETEDRKGIQLIGDAGQHLRRALRSRGVEIDLDKDCWKTNACICRPPGNKVPDNKIIDACRPNLIKTIKELKPRTIILLGKVALDSFIPMIWKEDVGQVGRWVGWNIPCQKYNAWVCPSWHPSFLMRNQNEVEERLSRQHLKIACHHKEKPWKEVPNYKGQVEVLDHSSAAVKAIKSFEWGRGMFAFDYETNCLKPEETGSEIVCCSISNGDRTIAFPWTDRTSEAMASLLKTDIPKIGANIKFEDRWTKKKLGFHIRKWYWDTVLAAHVLDNRPGITGVKFQTFIQLGAESYDDQVKPFLQSKGSSRLNRIREADLRDVMLYNGLDSLYEYLIAIKQMKLMKKQWKRIEAQK